MPVGDTPNGGASGATDLTVGYYDNDLVRSLTQTGATTTFTLDASGRRKTATSTGTGAHTLVRHYTDSSDNPGWETDTVGSTTTITHFVETLGGDLGVTVTDSGAVGLPLATLHGDVVASASVPVTGDATGIGGWADYDEYGNPRDAIATKTVTGASGYGWLGAKQRPASDTGLHLMGVRIFNPVTGRFLQTDPIPGGSADDYDYANQDPVNSVDLSGKSPPPADSNTYWARVRSAIQHAHCPFWTLFLGCNASRIQDGILAYATANWSAAMMNYWGHYTDTDYGLDRWYHYYGLYNQCAAPRFSVHLA